MTRSPYRRLAVVTGASRGIGRAIVESLAKAPGSQWSVIATARDGAAMEAYRKEIPEGTERIQIVPGDVCDSTVQEKIEGLVRDNGRLDLLVHNAGIIDPIAPILASGGEKSGSQLSVDTLKAAFDVNFFSAVSLTQKLAPFMQKSGVEGDGNAGSTGPNSLMLFVSSGCATQKFLTPGWMSYCSTKAALLQFACVLAKEESQRVAIDGQEGGRMILSTSLGPGIVDTKMHADIQLEGNRAGQDPGTLQFLAGMKKEGKMRPPAEVGELVARVAERVLGLGEGAEKGDEAGSTIVGTLHGKYLEFAEMAEVVK